MHNDLIRQYKVNFWLNLSKTSRNALLGITIDCNTNQTTAVHIRPPK